MLKSHVRFWLSHEFHELIELYPETLTPGGSGVMPDRTTASRCSSTEVPAGVPGGPIKVSISVRSRRPTISASCSSVPVTTSSSCRSSAKVSSASVFTPGNGPVPGPHIKPPCLPTQVAFSHTPVTGSQPVRA